MVINDGRSCSAVRAFRRHSSRKWLSGCAAKPPLTAAIESIAVAGQRSGGGATWAEAKAVARGLHGGFAIVKGLGYRLYPSTKSTMYSVPKFLIAFLLLVLSRVPAMRENLATGLNECRALIDTMVAA